MANCVLSHCLGSNAQSIADALEGSGNIADDIRELAESYSSRVDTLIHTIDQQSPELAGEIQRLLNQSVQEQQEGFNNIGKIAGAISQTQLRIQFLSTLGG